MRKITALFAIGIAVAVISVVQARQTSSSASGTLSGLDYS